MRLRPGKNTVGVLSSKLFRARTLFLNFTKKNYKIKNKKNPSSSAKASLKAIPSCRMISSKPVSSD
jgi:hypothetical protein